VARLSVWRRGYRGSVTRQTRWITENAAEHSQHYIERFRRLAMEGTDLAGEARLADAMLPRASRVLDAGCGQGRVGAELAARGHEVTGVDADARLIAAARADHPGPRWIVADLAELDLSGEGDPSPSGNGEPSPSGNDRPGLFDGVVMAGNVMLFVAEDTEEQVLRRVAAHLRPDGVAIIGFAAGRGYDLPDFDRHTAAAGLTLEHRFATWDLRPWRSDSPFSVTVLRPQCCDGDQRRALTRR
jgi:SAM-dependent methyltransferase